MDRLTIKRSGGLAGLTASCEIETSSLAEADRAAIEDLFRRKGKFAPTPGADRFVFSVTRVTDTGTRTLKVPEQLVPSAISRAVKDALP